MSLQDFIHEAYNSEFGGTWRSSGGGGEATMFTSDDKAMEYCYNNNIQGTEGYWDKITTDPHRSKLGTTTDSKGRRHNVYFMAPGRTMYVHRRRIKDVDWSMTILSSSALRDLEASEAIKNGIFYGGALLSAEDVYNNFLHNHSTYLTTKGVEKPIFNPNGSVRSVRAAQFANISKFVKWTGTAGTYFTIGTSSLSIYKDGLDVRNSSDLTVGAITPITPILARVGVQIATKANPYVGIGAASYSIIMFSWDAGKIWGPSTWYGSNDSKYFE